MKNKNKLLKARNAALKDIIKHTFKSGNSLKMYFNEDYIQYISKDLLIDPNNTNFFNNPLNF